MHLGVYAPSHREDTQHPAVDAVYPQELWEEEAWMGKSIKLQCRRYTQKGTLYICLHMLIIKV